MKHFLTVSVPDQKAIKYALKGKTISIGRASANAITLEIPEVSSHHLEIRATDDGGYRIVDLGSTNGTTVNGEKVTEHQLADGDELVIGLFARAGYAAVADEAAGQASPAQPLQPKVVAQNPQPATPTVVLKKAPAAASQPQPPSPSPATPEAPSVKIRKMTPPGANPAKEEAEAPLPVAQAVPEESPEAAQEAEAEAEAEAETETATRPKLAIPNAGQGPKKLNLG